MESENRSGRLTCMTDIAPSHAGTLPNISIDRRSENLEIPRTDLFSEVVYQTTMNTFKPCTAVKSPVTVPPFEPIVWQIAL